VRFCGIDPGVTGALAFLNDGVPSVVDMPRDMDGVNGHEVYALLRVWEPDEVYVERTHAMPVNGSKAGYSLGDSNGSIRAAVHIAHVPLIWVTPRSWQQSFGLFGGAFNDAERKTRSRHRAIELYPTLADQLGRIKDHNRAEALLIATYGARTSITQAVISG
jgi:hypothetical protein